VRRHEDPYGAKSGVVGKLSVKEAGRFNQLIWIPILSIAKDPAVALAWRVNDGSCARHRKPALFRAAAADSCHPERSEG
jgi:hypothetical protein